MSSVYDQFTAAVRDRDEETAADLVEYLDHDAALVEFLRDEGRALLARSPGLGLEYVYRPHTAEVLKLGVHWYGVRLVELEVDAVLDFARVYADEYTERALEAWESSLRERGAHPDLVEAARTRSEGFGLRREQRAALETTQARDVNLAFSFREGLRVSPMRTVFGPASFANKFLPGFVHELVVALEVVR